MKDLGQELTETLLVYKREPVRLLLVEDNPEDANLAQHEFSDYGAACIIEHVWTGEQGIEAVQKIAAKIADPNEADKPRQFDIALVDLVLPGRSGIEAAKHMIGFAPLIVIFICSGALVPHGAMEEAVDKGFMILPKPLRRTHAEMILNAVKSVKEKQA